MNKKTEIELNDFAEYLADEACRIINERAKGSKKFPYAKQFTLEKLIAILQERV